MASLLAISFKIKALTVVCPSFDLATALVRPAITSSGFIVIILAVLNSYLSSFPTLHLITIFTLCIGVVIEASFEVIVKCFEGLWLLN